MELILLYFLVGVMVMLKASIEALGIPADEQVAHYATCIIFIVAWPFIVFVCILSNVIDMIKGPIYEVGDIVVMKLDGRCPLSSQGYLYTVIKVKSVFGFFVRYDLATKDSSGNIIKQMNVPQNSIVEWADL